MRAAKNNRIQRGQPLRDHLNAQDADAQFQKLRRPAADAQRAGGTRRRSTPPRQQAAHERSQQHGDGGGGGTHGKFQKLKPHDFVNQCQQPLPRNRNKSSGRNVGPGGRSTRPWCGSRGGGVDDGFQACKSFSEESAIYAGCGPKLRYPTGREMLAKGPGGIVCARGNGAAREVAGRSTPEMACRFAEPPA